MKNPSVMLDEMLSSLYTIVSSAEHPVKDYIQSVEIVARYIRQLESQLVDYTFADAEEEIDFFKRFKPQFDGRLIYYLRLVNLEDRMPDSGLPKLRFLQRELRRIKAYYRLNKDFYRYLLTGATHLDSFYFTRSEVADPAYMDDFYHAYDPRVNTRLSFKAAKIHARKLLSEYIKDAMLDLGEGGPSNDDQELRLTWQAPKVHLAELIYGLSAMKVFGKMSTQQVVKGVTKAFNTRFANPYKVFEEIRLRKKNRTAFIDAMRVGLQGKMDYDDQFSL